MSDPIRVAAGRVAYFSRSDVGTDDKLGEARRDLRAEQLKKAVREAVDAAPPLTEAQRREIRAILAGRA